jgi:hypothetical protein
LASRTATNAVAASQHDLARVLIDRLEDALHRGPVEGPGSVHPVAEPRDDRLPRDLPDHAVRDLREQQSRGIAPNIYGTDSHLSDTDPRIRGHE